MLNTSSRGKAQARPRQGPGKPRQGRACCVVAILNLFQTMKYGFRIFAGRQGARLEQGQDPVAAIPWRDLSTQPKELGETAPDWQGPAAGNWRLPTPWRDLASQAGGVRVIFYL